MTSTAQVHFVLLISTRILTTPVCSLIHSAVFLSLRITPIIFHSTARWEVLSFWSFCVIFRVSAPFVRTVRNLRTQAFLHLSRIEIQLLWSELNWHSTLSQPLCNHRDLLAFISSKTPWTLCHISTPSNALPYTVYRNTYQQLIQQAWRNF